MKQCNTCKQWKDESEFHKDKTKKDGYATSCILCKRHGKPRYIDLIKPTGKFKQCTSCRQLKDTSEFYKDKTKPDGLCTRCKICCRTKHEIIKTTDRNELGQKYCKFCNTWKPESEFYKNSGATDGLNTRCKTCCYNYDRGRINERRLYNENRKDKIKQYQQQYHKENKEKLNTYARNKWATNLNFRVSNNVSGLIRHVLKTGVKAERHWETLVPYTLEDLMKHLESQFTPEMSWNNYGSYWEIDHIIPQNTFNITSPEDSDFQICWSLANLRPLEKSLNRQRPKDGSDVPENLKYKILKECKELKVSMTLCK